MNDDQLEFHLPAPPATGGTPLVPARMVNEFVY
jgi:CRISP-associated protein Cas1